MRRYWAIVRYRTRTTCSEWVGPIDADDIHEAQSKAVETVKKKRRAFVKLDSTHITEALYQ